jgi:hypothetical protein
MPSDLGDIYLVFGVSCNLPSKIYYLPEIHLNIYDRRHCVFAMAQHNIVRVKMSSSRGLEVKDQMCSADYNK